LRESQTEELIPAREIFDVTMTVVAIDAELKLIGWDEPHQLSKNGLARVHGLPPKQSGEHSYGVHERLKIRNRKIAFGPLLSFAQTVTANGKTFTGQYWP
jgi:hypothetical protein